VTSAGFEEKGMMQAPDMPDRRDATAGRTRLGTGFGRAARRFMLRCWKAARRWKVIIFSILVSALVLGVLITLLISTQFTARSRIEVNHDQNRAASGQGAASDRDSDFYNTQYLLLQARSLAVRVVRSMKLAQDDGFFQAHGEVPPGGFDRAQRLTPNEAKLREQLAIELLEKHIGVVPNRGSSLIDITYTSRSPTWSAKIVNEWVRQFVASSVDRRFASTIGARRFLEDRLNDLRARIEQSDLNATLYASHSGIVPLGSAGGPTRGGGQTLAASDFVAVNDAYHKAMAQRALAQSRADAGGGAAAEGASPTIALLRAKRAEVDAEYARLSAQFKPAYPALMAVAQQRKALDENIEREEKRAGSTLTAEYQDAARLESRLKGEVGRLKSRLDRENYDNIQFDILRREADTNRQLYDGYLQRYKQISVADIGASDISIVDLATVPEKPSSPNLLLNMGLAMLAGVVLASAVTYVMERNDEGRGEPSDIADLLDIPLLGTIRDVPTDGIEERLSDPASPLSETYRKIATRLASVAGGMPRSLAVTSARQGEGKSTTSLGLAHALARSGKKVVLVDADMRRPSLHQSLDIPNDAGLSNFLTGDEDWRALVQSSRKKKGVAILPAGPMPPGAAELLSTERMGALVGHLREVYDHVIVDAPPLLDLADAPLIARAVENIVFVIEAGGAGIRTLRSAIERLHQGDAHVAGAIFTKLGDPNADYRYDKL
jgi:capsular exopolysaccharide synthesis family protein